MLWMFRRVIFGPLTNPENQKLTDLNGREISLMAPILLLIVLMGVYPQPFLERMKPAVELSLQRILNGPQTTAAAKTEPGGELTSRGR
jgi:NADH-quinone oxidoreductase subunit M